MDKKTSAKFVIGLMTLFVLVAAILTWIMIKNYTKDTSKERSKLTQEHKEASKQPYAYDSKRGMQVYNQFCMRCHGADGKGGLSAPPLAGSKLATGEHDVVVKIVSNGMKGKIQRGERSWDMIMPGFKMITNEDLAHVLNYVRKSFGNDASEITRVQVIEAKVKAVERQQPWTEAELLK